MFLQSQLPSFFKEEKQSESGTSTQVHSNNCEEQQQQPSTSARTITKIKSPNGCGNTQESVDRAITKMRRHGNYQFKILPPGLSRSELEIFANSTTTVVTSVAKVLDEDGRSTSSERDQLFNSLYQEHFKDVSITNIVPYLPLSYGPKSSTVELYFNPIWSSPKRVMSGEFERLVPLTNILCQDLNYILGAPIASSTLLCCPVHQPHIQGGSHYFFENQTSEDYGSQFPPLPKTRNSFNPSPKLTNSDRPETSSGDNHYSTPATEGTSRKDDEKSRKLKKKLKFRKFTLD